MESAVSFAPLRPAGFVNFTRRGGAAIPDKDALTNICCVDLVKTNKTVESIWVR